jgi:putative Holliday junction resolvase
MTRILGIDHGEARIGLAISDELGMLAHPLETVPGRDVKAAIGRIVEVVREKNVSSIVLGLPLRMDGSSGTAVDKVRTFAKTLAKRLPDNITLIESDERLTTVSAWEKLHAAGRNEKNSRHLIDQAAAIEILQDYLDSQAPLTEPPPPEL